MIVTAADDARTDATARRSVHTPLPGAVSQIPFPGFAPSTSAVLFTTNALACAEVTPAAKATKSAVIRAKCLIHWSAHIGVLLGPKWSGEGSA
jgi:hypothetical protein